MKKFLTAVFVLMLFAAPTQAAEPVRIARLPIIFLSTIPDDETCAMLETKIERALHIPLNGTLQLAEYLPLETSARTLNELWQERRTVNKREKISAVIRPLADALDADIVVCPILREYSQFVAGYSARLGETILNSHARAELIVYDRRTDTLTDKTASRVYRDSFSRIGTASYLARDCFDKLIESTKLRQLILDIR